MTTTPGAVQGILVVGARKHSTPQAMAPRCTTTQSTDVRIHPTPYASPSLSPVVSASSRTPAPLTVVLCGHVFVPHSVIRAFYEPQSPLSLRLRVGAVRLRMQVGEGHGCCRRGGLLRWKDVEIAKHLLLNLRWASLQQQQQEQMWPVTVVAISDHTDSEHFNLPKALLPQQLCLFVRNKLH